MKGMDLFCASPASTAICVSIDQKSMVRHGSRAIDRHTPRLIDSRRYHKPPNHPSSNNSHPSPSKSKFYNQLPPSSQSTSSNPKLYNLPLSSSSSSHQSPSSKPKSYLPSSSKKSVKSYHSSSSSSSKSPSCKPKPYRQKARKSCAEQKDIVSSPPDSSRYLLGDAAFFDVFSDFEPVLPGLVVSAHHTGSESIRPAEEFPVLSPLSPRSHEQVVVLRVSLHCKGCEGKVKKHLSRMEGVKSFNIDFSKKKVTVIGDVTPLGVLASISRVKNAQFWPSSPPSSTPSSIY